MGVATVTILLAAMAEQASTSAPSRYSRRHRASSRTMSAPDLRLGTRSASRVSETVERDGVRRCAGCFECRSIGRLARSKCRRRGCWAAARISRGTGLRAAARIERALCSQERHRGAEGSKSAAAPARNCWARHRAAARSRIESCSRPCLRGAGRATVPTNQGGGRRP